MRGRVREGLLALAICALTVGVLLRPGTQEVSVAAAPVTVVAGGDLCGFNRGAQTCGKTVPQIQQANPDAVLPLGDLQYSSGQLSQFNSQYDPQWGRFFSITHPAPGNHEYQSGNANGYLSYWGDRATPNGNATWYSVNVGAWHIVSLNSNCSSIGGCDVGSAQYSWLNNDLASDNHQCTLAYFHHPRYTSGTNHGPAVSMDPIWDRLAADDAELVLSGHNHQYERFAPQQGITQMVIGNSGVGGGYPFGNPMPNSVRRLGGFRAVGVFTLADTSWSMQLRSTTGAVRDSASGTCV